MLALSPFRHPYLEDPVLLVLTLFFSTLAYGSALHEVKIGDSYRYFHENTNSSHLDARFSLGTPPHHQPTQGALTALVCSYVETMHNLDVTTWLAHGTLLGWHWGQRLLPWDVDADFHVALPDLTFLGRHYNMTTWSYEHFEYLLDVNPMFVYRHARRAEQGRPPDENNIDARWVDKQTGLFIDITALDHRPFSKRRLGTKNDGPWLVAKDGHSYRVADVLPLEHSMFEHVHVYVPHSPDVLLAREYTETALTMDVFRGLVHDHSNSAPSWQLLRALANGIPFSLVFRYRYDDQQHQWLKLSLSESRSRQTVHSENAPTDP